MSDVQVSLPRNGHGDDVMMMIQGSQSLVEGYSKDWVGVNIDNEELKVVEMMVSLMVLGFFHSFSVDPEKMQPELVLLVLLGVKLLISLH